jgi:cholesterol transport system auxiliary component
VKGCRDCAARRRAQLSFGRARLLFAGLVALAGAAGCFGGLHSTARSTQVYVLRASPPAQRPAAAVSIQVGRPIAGPGLDTEHIMLVQSDHRMSYYVASNWAAALPDVVEGLAVESLRNSGAWTAVQDSSSAFPSDYMLQIVIRRFEADYSGNPAVPTVYVAFDCILGRRSARDIVASFVAQGSSLAAANRVGDVVSAFEAAANEALGSIATHSAQAVQAQVLAEDPTLSKPILGPPVRHP